MTRHPRAPRGLLLLAGLLLLTPGLTLATIMRYMSVGELTRASTDVVRGKVLGQTARWADNGGGILTYVDVQVLERVKGNRPMPDVVQIVNPGGELDGKRMEIVDGPVFHDGEEAFFFVSPYSSDPGDEDRVILIGGRMGKMPVVPGENGGQPVVVRELHGVQFAVLHEDGGTAEKGVQAHHPDQRIPIDEFRDEVRKAAVEPPAGRNP